jgi:N utilization substance protein A
MQWSDDPQTLIARALSPANPTSVKLNTDTEPPRARVEVPADEVSQAIGKKGVNIKLATQLTGYEIDVFREIPADEEDIDIEEFSDELEEETIQSLRRIGCDTGKAVLELSADALARRAGLDRGTAERVLDIIETEFEKGPGVIESIERGKFTVQTVGEADESAEPSASPDDVDAAAEADGTGAAESVADAPDELDADEATADEATADEVAAEDAEDEETEAEEPEDDDADAEDTETEVETEGVEADDSEAEDSETEDAEAPVEDAELDEEPVASGTADGAETDEEAVAEAETVDAEAEEAGGDDAASAASETSPPESVEGSGSGTEPTADAPAEDDDETDPDTSTTAASDAVQESGVK